MRHALVHCGIDDKSLRPSRTEKTQLSSDRRWPRGQKEEPLPLMRSCNLGRKADAHLCKSTTTLTYYTVLNDVLVYRADDLQ